MYLFAYRIIIVAILSLYFSINSITHSLFVLEYSFKDHPMALFIKNSFVAKLLTVIFSKSSLFVFPFLRN